MRCPTLTCNSHNVASERKYGAFRGDSNRTKYIGMNVDRRRYVCLDCSNSFYTIEALESDFSANYHNSSTIETKSRIR